MPTSTINFALLKIIITYYMWQCNLKYCSDSLHMIEMTEVEIIQCLKIKYHKALHVTENSVTSDY